MFLYTFLSSSKPGSSLQQAPPLPFPPRSVAGSHTESWTVGQAARCKTLLGLRQQLCKGLLLQPILAARRRSHGLTWSPQFCFPSPAWPRSQRRLKSNIFPTTGQGYFMAHIKMCSICCGVCCHRAFRSPPQICILFLTPLFAIWLFKTFKGPFCLTPFPDGANAITQITQQLYESGISLFFFVFSPDGLT